MRLSINLRESDKIIDLPNSDEKTAVVIDGRAVKADVVQIAPTLYSILIAGRSFEVHIKEVPGAHPSAVIAGHEYPFTVRDARQWRRRRGTALEAEGRRQVIASMPGKIIRLLARAGETVQAGQGLLVIEAMKMQNEVRSPKSGTLERLLVKEAQTVKAGETLAILS